MKLLSSQAKSEQKLLDTYHANLPQQRPLNADTAFAFEKTHVDNNSISVLKLFCPALCETLVPLRTVGDGNCLYRAVSLACFSHEGHHVLLRLLVAIEIALNRTFYNKDKTKHKMLKNVFVISSDVNKLLCDALTLGAYSEMAHMVALSSVLGVPIRSFYPPLRNPEFSNAFTGVVIGRSVNESYSDTELPEIMWTSTGPHSATHFNVNHFVPLVSKLMMVNQSVDINLDNGDDDINIDAFRNEVDDVDLCEDDNVTCCVDDDCDVDVVVDNDVVVGGDDDSDDDVGDDDDVDGDDDEVGDDDNDDDDEVGDNDDDKHIDIDNVTCCDDMKRKNVVDDDDVGGDDDYVGDDDVVNSCDVENNDVNFSSLEDGLHGTLPGNFLSTEKIVDILTHAKTGLKHIPGGRKENVYFILDNSRNFERRKNKQRSDFSDDCGVWASSSGASPKQYFLSDGKGNLTSIHFKDDQYGKYRSVNRKRTFTPLDPQPDPSQVVVIQRNFIIRPTLPLMLRVV